MYVDYISIKLKERNFPDGAVVKTLPSKTGGAGKMHGQGGGIPHASWPKKPKCKAEYCNKFNKSFLNGPHQKKLKKKNEKKSLVSIITSAAQYCTLASREKGSGQ